MLRLADICKNYRLGPISVDVLRGIRLEVNRGDLLSITGASGCGKSTLMHILGLLDRPTSGSYLLEGREVATMDDNELSTLRNASMGFVFQSFHLLPRLTTWENVGLPLVYRGLGDTEIRQRSQEILEKVGMQDRTDHTPSQLSGGQQQRVAIARALVGAPRILLADEPTGALDTRTGREIMQIFFRLNAEDGLTVILITHDQTIAQQCPRRARLSDGRLHEDTPPSGLTREVLCRAPQD